MRREMTEGKIYSKIALFALPIFIGQLFQQMYNIADSLVVGKVLGKQALAAVSSSGSLIFLIVGFIYGVFVGAGVVIGRYYGAQNFEKVHKAVHTTVAFGLVAGVILMVFGMTCTPLILRLMNTPAEVLPESIKYFRMYFAGSIGSVLYNAFNGIFQARGDSRHPLYYLITASMTNVALDILFVKFLGWGIVGAAAATAISQFFSATLSFIKLTTVNDVHRITPKDIRFDLPLLREILATGLPTGVQNSVIGFANVIVQTNINAFGEDAMAGCGAYSKLEGFAFLPVTSFSVALTTFTSQNLGAKKYDRVKKGTVFGLASGVAIAELIGILFVILAPHLIAMFNSDPAVIAFGVRQARTEALFYCLLSLSHCMAGIIRGSGKTTVPMLVMLICWCLIRVTYITITVRFINDIGVVFWAYPLTWSLSSIAFVFYYFKADWMHNFERQELKKLKNRG
ncbi:MAG: MATE family efflux transporter [Clostridia bacterium]|nr:MATE family efflux transporter [Clostridia bacterium]MBR6006031.1 MATE family efflux transporter [Clostridia bacterium]